MKTLKAYNKKQPNAVKSKLLLVLMATKQSQPDNYDFVACLVATKNKFVKMIVLDITEVTNLES